MDKVRTTHTALHTSYYTWYSTTHHNTTQHCKQHRPKATTCTVHWSWMPFTLSLSTSKLGWTQVSPLSLQTTSNIPQVTDSQILVLVCRGDGGSEARWAAHQTWEAVYPACHWDNKAFLGLLINICYNCYRHSILSTIPEVPCCHTWSRLMHVHTNLPPQPHPT